MEKIKNYSLNANSFFTIYNWMIELMDVHGITAKQLMCYALVYSLTEGQGQGRFTGSMRYLAGRLHSSKDYAYKTIMSLVKKGLILRSDGPVNQYGNYAYWTNPKYSADVIRKDKKGKPIKESQEQAYSEEFIDYDIAYHAESGTRYY